MRELDRARTRLLRFGYYAQCGQDRHVLERYFAKQRDGFFVDVGMQSPLISTELIDIDSGGEFHGFMYAPNVDLRLPSSLRVYGAVGAGRVEREHNRVMRAWADPEKSDFRRADEVWEFSEHDGGTRVIYRLKMIPGFWVPPAIGPYLIKRKLRKDGGSAIDRIEEVARQVADRDVIF